MLVYLLRLHAGSQASTAASENEAADSQHTEQGHGAVHDLQDGVRAILNSYNDLECSLRRIVLHSCKYVHFGGLLLERKHHF